VNHITDDAIAIAVAEVKAGEAIGLPAFLLASGFYDQAMKARALRSVLDEVEDLLRHSVAMGEHERVAVTLWIAQTYVEKHFPLATRLLIGSVDPACGKTKLARLIARLSHNGEHFSTKVTDAYLGRLKEDHPHGLTVVLDQLDNAFDMKAAGTASMIDRLIAGADRGAKQGVLMEEKGQGWKPQRLAIDFPAVLVKIGMTLPSKALWSRCILIPMYPATAEDHFLPAAVVEKRIARLVRPQQPPKGRQGEPRTFLPALLPTAMRQREKELTTWEPAYPAGFINRDRDKWKPLFAVAEAAGVKWTRRAHLAAMALAFDDDEEERSPERTFLANVVAATKDWAQPFATGEEIARALGSPTGPRWVAERLKDAGIRSRMHGKERRRVYFLEDLRRVSTRSTKSICRNEGGGLGIE
jgi:hypothetical protein